MLKNPNDHTVIVQQHECAALHFRSEKPDTVIRASLEAVGENPFPCLLWLPEFTHIFLANGPLSLSSNATPLHLCDHSFLVTSPSSLGL